MQVPFRMPSMRKSRSPASPSRTARTMGMPPATDASNSSSRLCRRASASSSTPCAEISCLLAVTTDLPACSERRIRSPAGCSPPITSTTMSASDPMTASRLSVQCTCGGTQSTFFRSTPRLQIAAELQRRMDAARQHLGHRAADGAETDDGDFQRRAGRSGPAMRAGAASALVRSSALLPRLDRDGIEERHHAAQLRAHALDLDGPARPRASC